MADGNTNTNKDNEKDKDKYNGWVELFLPIQTLQTENIYIHPPKQLVGQPVGRPVAGLWYTNQDCTMNTLNILTTGLRIHSWDSSTGRLELETDTITAAQIIAIQKRILAVLETHKNWFPQNTNIQQDFQYMYHNSILTVYLHGFNPDQLHTGRVWSWSDSVWKQGVGPTSLRKGQMIRLAIRFQGICFLKTDTGKTRYRIQHQTVAIYHK